MADASAEKLKVFISYSRKDSTEFADELVVGLEDRGFAPFLDRHDIKPGEPWEARLGGLIEQADAIIFVISPEAVKSERCVWEVDKTLALSKRLLPVIHRPVSDGDIPAKLRELQSVRFDTGPSVMRPLRELADALRVDLAWIREHTRLGELATRWQARGQPESLLLRGEEVDAAKAWVTMRKGGAPGITEAQRAFIGASEEAESARLGKERAQLQEMARAQAAKAKSQARAGRLLWGVAAMILTMLGYVVWKGYDVETLRVAVFTSLAARAMDEDKFDLAMRYALQAYPARGHLPWLTPFSTELEGKLAGGAQSTQLRHVLNGHTRTINVVSFSRDGKKVLTASDDATTRIWETETGREIAVLEELRGAVLNAAFNVDGTQVFTASWDKAVRIWDTNSGKQIAVVEGTTGNLMTSMSASFSADGRWAVTTNDEVAHIWEMESGKEIALLKSDVSIFRAAFSGDGKRIVTVSVDDAARIWDVQSSKVIAILTGHTGLVSSATFSADGNYLVTTSYDQTARIWGVESGKEIAVLNGHTNKVTRASFSFDGKRVVTVSDDHTARIWDVLSGRENVVLRGHVDKVHAASFSFDNSRVLTGSDDNSARVWDAESGDEIAVLKGHTDAVRSVAFSADGKRVVTGSSDNSARIWDAESGKTIAILKAQAKGSADADDSVWEGASASFNSDDNRVAVAGGGTARIWSAETATETFVLTGHEFLSGAFSADGKLVVTVSYETASIWDAESGGEIAVLKGHTGWVISAAFSPDTKRVVTASSDKTARIWDAQSGTEIAILKGHTDSVSSAAFSTDGKRIVTASLDATVRIWSAESGNEIVVLERPKDIPGNATFSPDGKWVVATYWFVAVVWDAESGKPIVELVGHTDSVNSAAFSGDGRRIVTASKDKTVRIWDAESGTQIAILKGHTGAVQSAAFDRRGSRVVTVSTDGSARIWDVTWATLVRGDALRERVCDEKLIGAAQQFAEAELQDPILRGIEKDDSVARNPCLRRGPLSLDYWTRLPIQFWRSLHVNVFVNRL